MFASMSPYKLGSKRMLRRAFRYGVYHARLRLMYGKDGVEIAGVAQTGAMLLRACLNLAGQAIGYLLYGSAQLFRKGTHGVTR